MKIKLLSLSLLILNGSFLLGQSPVWELQWDVKAGGSEADIIGTFQITPDSGFLLCGTSFSGISGDKTQSNHDTSLTTADFWLVKTDSSGSIQWETRYGGTLAEILSETIVTADGGYLSGGQSFSDIGGDKTVPNWDTSLQSNDYWIIKTDASGSVQWDNRYGGTAYELFGAVRQCADGGFIMTGSSFSGADGDKTELSRGGWDYWVVRTDGSGAIIWDKRFGGTGDDFSLNVVLTGDGNYVVAGYSNSGQGGDKSEPNRGNWDYWMIKVDDTGSKIWDKTFGGNYNDWLFALSSTNDGGFILGGQSFSQATGDKSEPNHDPTPSGSDMWVVKTDADGNKQWDKTVGGTETDDLGRIIQTSDGGYLLSGESYSDSSGHKTEPNLGPEQTWVVKIDSAGIFQWDKTLFTHGHDESGSAIPYGDNCFVAVNFTQADSGGFKSEIGWGNGDYWMLKMCEEALLSNHEIPNSIVHWQGIPNPFLNEINLLPYADFNEVTLQLYDATGKKLDELTNVTGAASSSIRFNTTDFAPGVYFFRIIEAKKVSTIRIVKAG